jgi:hypothetical protein
VLDDDERMAVELQFGVAEDQVRRGHAISPRFDCRKTSASSLSGIASRSEISSKSRSPGNSGECWAL